MGIRYEIIGYDKVTERVAYSYPIPLRHQRGILRTYTSGDGMGEYPLSMTDIEAISLVIGDDIDPEAYDYHLCSYYFG